MSNAGKTEHLRRNLALPEWANIAEIIGAVAIVVSLIRVSLEV